jgi:hypothetical protein
VIQLKRAYDPPESDDGFRVRGMATIRRKLGHFDGTAAFHRESELDFIHLEHKWRTERSGTASCRLGFSISRTILDVPKVISLIINELYFKDFMPYGNG